MNDETFRLQGGAVVTARTVAEAIEAAQLAKLSAGTSSPADSQAFRDWAAARCQDLGVDPADAGITELTAINATRADGVTAPATGIGFLLTKAAAGARAPLIPHVRTPAVGGLIVKTEAEQRFTLCVAYPADRADAALARDGHRDYASKAVVEATAWNYLRDHRQVGLHHENGTDGAGQVVESYVWPDGAPGWTVKSGAASYTVKPGDWLLGIQWTPEAWKLIKSGKIGGVSIQGSAARRVPAGEAVAALTKAAAARGGLLSRAEHYSRLAGQVADPAMRESYEQLANRARREAGAA